MSEAEVLIKTNDARVRIMLMTPHEKNDWHFHTEVTDDIFGLTGTIVVRVQNPDEEVRLAPGQRCQIKTGRVHQVENPAETASSYLLVQGIGKYDFNVIHAKPE